MISKNIYITTRIEFIHTYKDAPDEVAFLRYPHRHLLHIKATIEVFNEDRELEFIIVKRKIENYLHENINSTTNMSCENICSMLLLYLQECYGTDRNITIVVSEDGENGAETIYTKE